MRLKYLGAVWRRFGLVQATVPVRAPFTRSRRIYDSNQLITLKRLPFITKVEVD
jgi:hypothetical protein